MDDGTVEEHLGWALTAPLDDVVDPAAQACPSPDLVAQWNLPRADRLAVTRWGLPDDFFPAPDWQPGVAPVLTPNVAGDHERQLVTPGQRLYQLGWWGSRPHDSHARIGAVEGDGRALAIRPAPVTAADLHPALRDHYRDLHLPAVDFINSSIAQLVEISWRWRTAVAALADLHEPPDLTRPAETMQHLDDLDRRFEDAQQRFLAGVAAIDPGIDVTDRDALWVLIVTDPGH